MANKDNIKEYGADLEKQWIDANKKMVSIQNKIIKRAKFLVKECPDIIVAGSPVSDIHKDAYDVMGNQALLFIIKKIEEDYVSKSKQLNMFEQKEENGKI